MRDAETSTMTSLEPTTSHNGLKRLAKGSLCSRLILSLLAIGLTGATCSSPIPPPKDMLKSSQALVNAANQATDEVKTARLKEMRLDYFGQQGRASVRQLILTGAPDRLRIQTYIPGLDGVAGVLVCACGQFAYHDRQNDVYHYGPARSDNIARVLPVGLSCTDLGSILLGGLPNARIKTEAEGEPELSWDDTTGRYKVAWKLNRGPHAGGQLVTQIRHGDWRVAEIKVKDSAGKLQYTYTAKSFERFGGQLLPTSRRFLVADDSEDISLSGDKVELNPELPDLLFQLEAPPGSQLAYLGDRSPPPAPPRGGNLCELESE